MPNSGSVAVAVLGQAATGPLLSWLIIQLTGVPGAACLRVAKADVTDSPDALEDVMLLPRSVAPVSS